MPENNNQTTSTYAYLQAGLQDRSSLFANARLLTLNNQYRYNIGESRAFSQRQEHHSPARQRLEDFQNILLQASQNTQEFSSATTLAPPSGMTQLTGLLNRLSNGASSDNTFAGKAGKRYVATTITLADSTDRINALGDTQSNRSTQPASQQARQYALHYFQDGNEEIVALQDVSDLGVHKAWSADRANSPGEHLLRLKAALGSSSPALYQSGRFGSQLDTDESAVLVLKRKIGEKQYQVFGSPDASLPNDSAHRDSAADKASAQKRYQAVRDELKQHLDSFEQAREFQLSAQEIIAENNAELNISAVRTESLDALIKDNLQQLGNFFPGLDQSFGVPEETANEAAQVELLSLSAIHMQNKLRPLHAQTSPASRAYRNNNIDPYVYHDYDQFTRIREAGQNLGNPLQLSDGRTQYANAQGVLQFANFETIVASAPGRSHFAPFENDDFTEHGSLIIGDITLLDVSPQNDLTAAERENQKNALQNNNSRSVINDNLNAVLATLGNSVDADQLRWLAAQKAGLNQGRGNENYARPLQGSINLVAQAVLGLNVGDGLRQDPYRVDPSTTNVAALGALNTGIEPDFSGSRR